LFSSSYTDTHTARRSIDGKTPCGHYDRQEHVSKNHNRVRAHRILDGTDVRTTIMLRNSPNKLLGMCSLRPYNLTSLTFNIAECREYALALPIIEQGARYKALHMSSLPHDTSMSKTGSPSSAGV
jgi:hypothetical protein